MTAGVRLFLFGGFRLENASGEVLSTSLRKAEALLAYLAMAPGKTASREKLATLLWGESDQQRARQSLRQALFALTREFAQAEVSVLRMESQMVSLDPAAIRVDVVEFQAFVETGDGDRLTDAVALYSGPFLQGFTVDSAEFDEWQMALQGRLDEAAIKAFLGLLDRQEAAGNLASAIETAQGALRIDRYREDVHRQLMRLFVASGMRSSALHQYRLCRDFLERELGVPPDAETDTLYREILEAGPAAAPDPEPAAPAGMAAARVRDRDRSRRAATVGRTAELRELDRHLQAAREGRGGLVVVTGEADEKVIGLAPVSVDRLYTATSADYILVEADGARSRSIKAPGDHEPVIPRFSTTVIVVVGVDAIGRPLEEVAHRPDRVAALTGLGYDDNVTVQDAATVLLHSDGGRKGLPESARLVMAITKVSQENTPAANSLAAILEEHPRVDRVVTISDR